ncbi:penicillin-binding protein activator [Hellea balneolensis]|uniref:penicillin-binding protein activator n=1 Tax=Hellea balneolensis TaxID=287478 RepID=UPI0004010F39|nr:penicillin-binding protein activator [Hellea balneolensis]
MAKLNGFGHLGIATLSLAALFMSACETVPVPQGEYPPRRPVVERPPVDPVPTPTQDPTEQPTAEKEVETKQPEPTTEPGYDTGNYVNNRGGLTPPHMAGRDIKRMALLLPFSAKSARLREEADSMLKAAELAVFNRSDADVLLMALDTKGSSSGARSATRSAIQSGADVILGPILAGSVKASASEARRSKTPLIAFSTDQTVAGNGTYLLSFPPEAEVKRIVDYVATTGATRFAYIGPQSEYGRRVKGEFDGAVRANRGEVTASEIYDGNDISVMQEPAKRLAEYHRQGEIMAKENGGTTPMSYEAILLPEGGTALRSLAPLFPYYDVDPAKVQFLGTGLWKNDETVREPALNGGIFAAADQDAKRPFLDNYDRTYGDEASRLASLAYDAIAVGAYVADGDPRGRQARAEEPMGFYGVDGLVQFNADGTPNRGLAVYQIKNGRFVIIDPAPKTVVGPS